MKANAAREPYPSALTDAQWQLLEPRLPPDPGGGRKRTTKLREDDAGLCVGPNGEKRANALEIAGWDAAFLQAQDSRPETRPVAFAPPLGAAGRRRPPSKPSCANHSSAPLLRGRSVL
jgi:hypothetical protein